MGFVHIGFSIPVSQNRNVDIVRILNVAIGKQMVGFHYYGIRLKNAGLKFMTEILKNKMDKIIRRLYLKYNKI
jgi:hypothetical protein